MHSGEIIAEGEGSQILGNKEAKRFYLGDTFKY
jgi:ABC-type lipopolysaccharide export system ATPase subunit